MPLPSPPLLYIDPKKESLKTTQWFPSLCLLGTWLYGASVNLSWELRAGHGLGEYSALKGSQNETILQAAQTLSAYPPLHDMGGLHKSSVF